MDMHKGAWELGIAGRDRSPSGQGDDALHMIYTRGPGCVITNHVDSEREEDGVESNQLSWP